MDVEINMWYNIEIGNMLDLRQLKALQLMGSHIML